MADGKITYEVRVDSSRVSSDLSQASAQIVAGTAVMVSLAQSASQRIGNAVASFFSAQTAAVNTLVRSLAGSLGNLAAAAGTVSAALAPVNSEIAELASSDLDKIIAFMEKLSELNGASASPASTLASKKTPTLGSQKSTASTPSYRSGSDYVPSDGYAMLHRGEAVLTSGENETLRAMGGMNGVSALASQRNAPVIVENRSSAPEIAVQPPQNVNVTVEMDGYRMAKVFADATNEMNRQMNGKILK